MNDFIDLHKQSPAISVVYLLGLLLRGFLSELAHWFDDFC